MDKAKSWRDKIEDRKKGFTMIELLFVTIIVGILIAIAVPRFQQTFNSMELSSVALKLQTFMNYMRQRSIVEGRTIYLNIDNGAKRYWAKAKNDEKPLKSESFLPDIEIKGADEPIRFYPNGTLDRADLKIMDKNGKTIGLLAQGGYGRVKLQDEQ
ncbi:MAG: prepilin-type N-terminal cleavage/methylation domain-containing protein [Candidatus Omnitrophica bacterium]|nr:prepilin-type N-terminal cleavage/methylation domain-containing protein [Candidatus Omnitrophota bacterium]